MTRLKEIRHNKHITQKEVADHIGCSVGAYSKYETGTREPSITILRALADYYEVSVDYLIGRDVIEHSALTENEKIVLDALRNSTEYVRICVYEILNILNSNIQE